MALVLRAFLLYYSLAVAGLSDSVVGQLLAQDGTQMNQLNISYGDIMLTPPNFKGASRVLIYYGNELDTAEWGEICALNVAPPEKSVATVICRQYGHKDGNFISLPSLVNGVTPEKRVWLFNVSCGANSQLPNSQLPYHILRCHYDVSYDVQDSKACTQSVGVICSDEYLADIDHGGYQGQVYLCPTDGFRSLNRSVSSGLVMLYLHDSWRTISLKARTDSSDLHNSLCRQLGFTGAVPNSGTSKIASQYSLDYCYSYASTYPYPYAELYEWLTTDQTDCRGSPRACSGCCYDYPYQQQRCPSNSVCNKDDDLVISCTFDTMEKYLPVEGDPDLCAFKTDTPGSRLDSPVCAQQGQEISLQTFAIVVGVLGPFALLGVVLSISGVSYCCYRCCRRRPVGERQPLNAPPPRNHDDAGN